MLQPIRFLHFARNLLIDLLILPVAVNSDALHSHAKLLSQQDHKREIRADEEEQDPCQES